MVTIACDGSCLKNPGGAIGWAWARDDGAWLSDGFLTGSNQRAELLGFMSVLVMHPRTDLLVQMDSQFVINVSSKWINGWARKGWKKADGQDIANPDLVKPLYRLLKERTGKLEFQWVKGHDVRNTYPLNTVADLRAGEASRRIQRGQAGYLDSKGRTSLPKMSDFMASLAL